MAADKTEEALEEAPELPGLTLFNDFKQEPRVVPLTEIEPNSEINAPAPTASFKKSIERQGQIMPVILVPVRGKKWLYHVEIGRRRVIALRMLERPTVRAIIVPTAGEVERLLASIASNKQRYPNMMNDLDSMRRLEELGVPLNLTGYSTTQIKKAIRNSKADPALQMGMRQGLVSPATVDKIMSLDPARRKPLIKAVEQGQKITAAMADAAKHVQVGATGQALMQKLNIPLSKQAKASVEMLIVLNPATKKASLITEVVLNARNKAVALNDGSRVYRLVEI